ncbi:MAG: hypothetical protein NVSMB56_05790 [Pyrinomonadaceae bacterium]
MLFLLLFCGVTVAQESEYGEPLTQARILRDKDFRDPRKSPLEPQDIAAFSGLFYFSFNPAYKVQARFIRTPNEKKVCNADIQR